MNDSIEIQYSCKECGTFVVHHKDESRNTHCAFCEQEVVETGQVSRIEDDEIVIYKHENKVGRHARPISRR